jgi:hypothetical protein
MAQAFTPITWPGGVTALTSVSVPLGLTGLYSPEVAPPTVRGRGDSPATAPPRLGQPTLVSASVVWAIACRVWFRRALPPCGRRPQRFGAVSNLGHDGRDDRLHRNVKKDSPQHTATGRFGWLTAGIDIFPARAGTALLSRMAFTGRTPKAEVRKPAREPGRWYRSRAPLGASLRPGVSLADGQAQGRRVAHATRSCARRSDDTEARKATVRRFGRSHRSAQGCRSCSRRGRHRATISLAGGSCGEVRRPAPNGGGEPRILTHSVRRAVGSPSAER